MFKHLVAHEDGDDGGGGDDVDDNDDDVKDLEPPGGVERLVAGEAAEAVSVIVTACCDHLLSREYLPSRHDICQKFYTVGFSGQKFYTLIFTEFQQFWL